MRVSLTGDSEPVPPALLHPIVRECRVQWQGDRHTCVLGVCAESECQNHHVHTCWCGAKSDKSKAEAPYAHGVPAS